MTLRICGYPGCPEFTPSGYCDAHRPVAIDVRRSAGARGYGRRWTAYAAAFKRRHPYCRSCLTRGLRSPTEAVDHIVPVMGPGDPLFWDKGNHQALCRSCHAAKTQAEGRTSRASEPAPGSAPRRFIIA